MLLAEMIVQWNTIYSKVTNAHSDSFFFLKRSCIFCIIPPKYLCLFKFSAFGFCSQCSV